MNTGMLWFDNSERTLKQKIADAVEYYKKKYGKSPNLVLIHPSVLEEDLNVDDATVRPYRPVLPGHIWIGIED